MTEGTGILSASFYFAMGLLMLSLVASFIRLLRGPSFADRVLAIDVISVLMVGIIGTYAIKTGEPLLIRTGIVLALISFLGTTAFAFYITRRVSG
jgi:multicomponent Na+:H+ antiporter subunit F